MPSELPSDPPEEDWKNRDPDRFSPPQWLLDLPPPDHHAEDDHPEQTDALQFDRSRRPRWYRLAIAAIAALLVVGAGIASFSGLKSFFGFQTQPSGQAALRTAGLAQPTTPVSLAKPGGAPSAGPPAHPVVVSPPPPPPHPLPQPQPQPAEVAETRPPVALPPAKTMRLPPPGAGVAPQAGQGITIIGETPPRSVGAASEPSAPAGAPASPMAPPAAVAAAGQTEALALPLPPPLAPPAPRAIDRIATAAPGAHAAPRALPLKVELNFTADEAQEAAAFARQLGRQGFAVTRIVIPFTPGRWPGVAYFFPSDRAKAELIAQQLSLVTGRHERARHSPRRPYARAGTVEVSLLKFRKPK